MRALIESILGTIRMKLIEVGTVALILIILTFMWCGCGAIRTHIVGERTAKGFWVKQYGPGTAKLTEELPDGTKRTIETERPPLWSANVPQVIQLRDSP